MIEIPLSKKGKNAGKYVAIVDDTDAILAELNWSVSIKRTGIYACNVNTYLHCAIIERMQDGRRLEKGQEVDHIDGNGLNNTRGNLRVATRQQNSMNRDKQVNNTSGYKGVVWSNYANKWAARLWTNGKLLHLGYFDTPELAHEAYYKKAKELFGEFAK